MPTFPVESIVILEVEFVLKLSPNAELVPTTIVVATVLPPLTTSPEPPAASVVHTFEVLQYWMLPPENWSEP